MILSVLKEYIIINPTNNICSQNKLFIQKFINLNEIISLNYKRLSSECAFIQANSLYSAYEKDNFIRYSVL